MAYPEKLLSPGERVETEFRPHWKMLIAPVALLLLSIVVAITFSVVAEVSGVLGWAVPLGAVLLGLGFGAKSWIDWLFTKYIITTERLVIREGLIARRGKEIPLERIDNVAFSQTVGERILRSGDLIVESAGEGGQSRYTDIPRPEETQSLIYRIREARILALEGTAGRSAADEISKLAALRDQGVISDDEFESKKRKLLDDI